MAASRSTGTTLIGRMRLALERIGLPAWFVVIDLLWIAKPDVLGIDARHYQRATSTWLAGGDPWKVAEGGITYAAGPHTLLFYVPTSFLPLGLSIAVWMVLGLAASVWLVRRLGLPMWWLAFPPLAHAIWNGNPQTIVLALLVLGGSVPAAAAVALKLYAGGAPAEAPAALAVAVIALAVTLPLLPWQLYIQDGFGVTGHLQRPGTAAPGGCRSSSRRPCSGCGSCAATAPTGWPSRPSGRPPSSTTWRWRSR